MTDAAPVPDEQDGSAPCKKESPARQILSDLIFEKPEGVLAVAAGVPTLFYGIGLLTHAARESLLHMFLPLAYPHQNAILISLDVLWSLPWHTLTALFVGTGVSQVAWLLVMLLVALLAVERWQPEKPSWRRRALPITVGVVIVLLFFVISNYRGALFPEHVPGELGAAFRIDMGPSLDQRISTETISWLQNQSPLNHDRRTGLAGLSGWLLVVLIVLVAQVRRRFEPWPLARRATLAVLALLLFLVITDLPRAHVIATWGVSYPTVEIRENDDCDEELREAIENGGCCAYDVSAGGAPRTTLLLGDGCPDGDGFRTWSEEASHCLSTGPRRVTHAKDC